MHLRGEQAAYEPHCRGDACEHFAPNSLIQIHLPLRSTEEAKAHPPSQGIQPVPIEAGLEIVPLVSCIMPTGNRADYVLQAIHYLQRQDYPNWELIVVDDGNDDLAGRLGGDGRIRYERVRSGLSIGAKRNRACELARGDIFAQWDDDDWYGPTRLSAQVEPILAGAADITGLNDTIFFELDSWRFWRCTAQLHRRLFVEDVHGGTLVFQRRVWESLARYPDRSLAEDAFFLRQAVQRGARLARLPAAGLFLYLRHGSNAWTFPCGTYLIHLDGRLSMSHRFHWMIGRFSLRTRQPMRIYQPYGVVPCNRWLPASCPPQESACLRAAGHPLLSASGLSSPRTDRRRRWR